MAKIQSRHSIKNKLTILLMMISVVLLLIVSLVVLTAEVFATRAALIQELRVLTAAVGSNSRQALVLGQYQETEKFLAALATQKHIHAAYLFNHQGEPVAEYLSRKKATFAWKFLEVDFASTNKAYWTSVTEEQINASYSHLGIFTPVFYEEKRVGTLYVLSDLDALYGRLSGVAFGTTLSLILLFVFSWVLAGRLHKPVSVPLLSLAGVMEKVSARQDYSLRATKMSNDEIALLVDGLNHMLDQVEDHQRQQSRYQEHLESTVHQRTAELRAAVTQLEKARHQADAANEAKTNFLSRMTHELRTPLIGVLGMNGLLQRTVLTEQQRKLVDTVDKSGNDLLALISDVLDIARIEAGVLDLDLDDIEPARILEEVVELLAPQAQAKGVELVADIPMAALQRGRGDRARIWQIVMNLIGNAIKFTPEGVVTARLQLVVEGQEQGRFIFTVEDTGVGMDEATSRRVFDQFYQHSDLSSDLSRGSGLGLPIVKQLVDLMGGHISVTSQPAVGSCFTVEVGLPLVEPSRPRVSVDLTGMNVIVGVDSGFSAVLLERHLSELGAEVTRVDSAVACLSLLESLQRQHTLCRILLLSQDWHAQLEQGADGTLTDLTSQLVLMSGVSVTQTPVIDGVLQLQQPITWRRLVELLLSIPVQQQLSYETVAQYQDPESPVSAVDDLQKSAYRVVFVGRHAAERQLLKLTLAAWQIVPDYVDNLHEAVALSRYVDVILIILDAAELTAQNVDELVILKESLPPCYLLGEHDLNDPTIKPVTGYLKKPLNVSELHQILDPLLTTIDTSSFAASGKAI